MKKGDELYMKKRVFAIALVIVLALTLAVSAVEMRSTRVKPTLSFSGTTAYCDVMVSEANTYVEVTLELWRGTTLIDSWSASGLGRRRYLRNRQRRKRQELPSRSQRHDRRHALFGGVKNVDLPVMWGKQKTGKFVTEEKL